MAEGLDIPERGGHGGAESGHVTVLLKEAIEFLAVRRGGTYIDATVGLGGHSYEIAKRLGEQGRLIGFDKDPAALEIARERLAVGPSSLVVGEGKHKVPRLRFLIRFADQKAPLGMTGLFWIGRPLS